MVCDGKDLAQSCAEVTAPPTPQPGMARPSPAPTTVSVSRPGDGAAAVAPWIAMGIGEMFCFDWAGNVLKDTSAKRIERAGDERGREARELSFSRQESFQELRSHFWFPVKRGHRNGILRIYSFVSPVNQRAP